VFLCWRACRNELDIITKGNEQNSVLRIAVWTLHDVDDLGQRGCFCNRQDQVLAICCRVAAK
jgi:hypothetical protein